MNELIFLCHSLFIGFFALLALKNGKQALTAFIALQCILANLFILKQITLFGFTATASDAFSIGAVLGINLLQEYYDRKSAQLAIWISFGLLIFYAVVSQIHLLYLPATLDTMHAHYTPLLAFTPRIVIASFFVYLLVQHLDAWLYSLLKRACNNKYLIARNWLCIATCQLLDTILFSYAGLYGIIENIPEIIAVSYGVKLIAIALTAPTLWLSKKITS